MAMIRTFCALLALCLLSACGGGDARGERDRPAPLVEVAAVGLARFVERIDAVGTAVANEQVILSAPVTERIVRLGFEDGQPVARGQVIAVLAQGQQGAQLQSAEARAREAQQQLDRLLSLKTQGFATNAAVDAQTAAAAAARADAAAATSAIGDRVIRAPFSGVASLRRVSVGAIVSAGTEIATISDVSQIKLDFPVPETLLSAIAIGQPIEASAAAFPGQPFRGTVTSIEPLVDPATRSVIVRAVLPNRDRRLRPGMLLTVRVESAARTSLAVPELAVVGEGERRFVYVAGDDLTVRRTEVSTGIKQDGKVEILGGLSPGQRIVTQGVVKLSDDQKVRLMNERQEAPPGGRSGSTGQAR